MKRMKVFISHSMADKNLAGKMAEKLKAEGFTVTNPTADIGPGENIALKVGKALEQAGAMIALLSPDSARSEWVQNEIGFALGSPQFQGRLIPVMVKQTDRIPWILHDLNVLTLPSDPSMWGKVIGERLRPIPKSSGTHHRRTVTSRKSLARA